MKASRFLILVVIAVCAAASAGAQNKVQTIFNLEENVSKKAPIPEAVVAVLKSDKRVDACFQEKGEGADETAWFEASEIDLNSDGRMDLIVKARDACLFGANQGPFWVFQNAPDGYQNVLSASGLQLSVLPEKRNSFRRIKIGKAVAMKPSSRTFSFKNGKYR
jgi:hypothetical protein